MENELSLINKVVRVIDSNEGIDNSGIISFMYPSFKLRDEIFFDQNNDIIFNGKIKSSTKSELEGGTHSFIALCSGGFYDVDFTERENIIRVLYQKFNKSPSENILGVVEHMSNQEFWDYFKKFWVLGRSKLDDKEKSIYELYKVLGKQKFEILKVYFELRECYSDSMIFSSVLGFIEKSLNPDRVSNNNGRYLKMLEDFRKSYQGYLIPIIKKVYTMKSDKEYRTLWLLMQLGKGNII